MSDQLLICNCKLFNAIEQDELVDILIESGSIVQIGKVNERREYASVINANERVTAPGFIDIHIQGAGGADILDGTEEALVTMSRTLARLGTTSFLATTVVKPDRNNRHLKVTARYVNRELGGAIILGMHLEGPFINLKKSGGISKNSIFPPSLKALKEIRDIAGDTLKMMTIAPELEGNLEIIYKLVEEDVIASFGHSNATYIETKKGFSAGIKHVTHIFNVMPPLHHREPGPLLAIFESDDITVQIISDGVHVHPGIVNLVYRNIGKDRCICITDGVQAMGLPDGKYIYNIREYESKDGTARYLDGTLIGTTLSAWEIARKFMEFTNCSLEIAINTITKNPAKLLGIEDKKGSIDVGKDADLVILDHDNSIWLTIINGKVVFEKQLRILDKD